MLIATTRHVISRRISVVSIATCGRHTEWTTSASVQLLPCRRLLQTQVAEEPHVPFRKQLKDEIKRKRQHEKEKRPEDGNKPVGDQLLSEWELTVGLEIHAQLNTEHKLFSCESRPNG